MESHDLSQMRKEFEDVLTKALNVSYVSSGIEFQVASVNELAEFYKRTDEYREAAIQRVDEKAANAAFICQRFIFGTQRLLLVWVHIKQDAMEDAWIALVDAQEEIECGLRFTENTVFRGLAQRMLSIQNMIFPQQVFVSPGLTYLSASCTICGGEYGDCGHLAGRLYMGRMCALHPNEIDKVDHLALVEHPKDKACRVTAIREGDLMMDKLTRRLHPRESKSTTDFPDAEVTCLRTSERHICMIDLSTPNTNTPLKAEEI